MADIAIVWNVAEGQGGFALDPVTGLAVGNDLQTAVLISLFSDRVAANDDVLPDASGDPRGWWGDLDYPIGSKLWLRARSKQTPDVLELVKADVAEAMQWLLDDRVASAITVEVEFSRPGMLGARIVITRFDGSAEALQFEWAWRDI